MTNYKSINSEKQLERMELSGLLVESQDQLAARKFDDSRISVAIPLSDPYFRDKYLNTGRVVRRVSTARLRSAQRK